MLPVLAADPKRIAVGGDSAGGNLAAVVAQMATDRGAPTVRYQLLIYPVTNYSYDTASYKNNGEELFTHKRFDGVVLEPLSQQPQ